MLKSCTPNKQSSYTKSFQEYSSSDLDGSLFSLTLAPEFAEIGNAFGSVSNKPNTIIERYQNSAGGRMIRPGSTIKSIVAAYKPGTKIISTAFGSDCAGESLVAKPGHVPLYDFFSEHCQTPVGEEAIPIDKQYIVDIVLTWTRSIEISMNWLISGIDPSDIYHVVSPPPLKHPEQVPYLEIFENTVKQFGFLHPVLRLKWYLEYYHILESKLKQLGIKMINPPKECVDDCGYLLPEFAEGLTHANAAYGKKISYAILDEL